jgi:hypothetical protein
LFADAIERLTEVVTIADDRAIAAPLIFKNRSIPADPGDRSQRSIGKSDRSCYNI